MSRNKRERKASMSAPVLLNLSSDPITAIPGSNELEEFEDRPTILQRLRANWIIVAVVGIAALGVFGSTLKYLEEDATRQSPTSTKSGSILARLNPITPPPPTTQLSKEYIYAGSRLLAVEDANANAAPPADLAVWRSGDGNWHVMGGTGSAQTTYNWGSPGDIPTQGDYS